MIHPHVADALKVPDLVRLTEETILLRFESMKIYSALAAVRHLLERGTVRPWPSSWVTRPSPAC